jgi:hypothetical protein
MALECFVPKAFQRKTLELIEQINGIVEEYQGQGFVLTLRQLYYQLVARDVIENTQKSYKRVGSIVNDGRLAGLIDWEAIEDRTRNLRTHSAWESPADIIASARSSYREDLWRTQRVRLEVWIEKDALLGVIEGVCTDLRLPYFACRGNTSQSEAYKAGRERFAQHHAESLTPIVLHLGDHDPNGIDMTRDNRSRLTMFAQADVEVRRLALNMDQIEQFNPPPNPAKETDSRYAAYVRQFGRDCWELDALEPAVIANLIRTEFERLVDMEAWEAAKAEEADGRRSLQLAVDHWSSVEQYLANLN